MWADLKVDERAGYWAVWLADLMAGMLVVCSVVQSAVLLVAEWVATTAGCSDAWKVAMLAAK
jgi:hypothetical protein